MRELAEPGIRRIRAALRDLQVRRVIVWGYREPRHTHHWVMVAMHRALEHALRDDPRSPELLWLDNRTVGDPAAFDDALILSNVNVDHVDHCLPLRRRGLYLIHDHAPGRIDCSRYEPLRTAGRAVFYEVFRSRPGADYRAIEDQPLCYVHRDGDRVVMLWATDLLPHEIEQAWQAVTERPRAAADARSVVFVGSSWTANARELAILARDAVARGLRFEHYGRVMTPTEWPRSELVHVHGESVSMEENVRLVREATIAPALQGLHQLRNKDGDGVGEGNYVPCRIFKNISYGAFGVSNNPTAKAVLGDAVVCRSDFGEMLDAALEQVAADPKRTALRDAMVLVAKTHTYFDRMAMLLELTRDRHERMGRAVPQLRDDDRLRLGLRRVIRRSVGWSWQ
ncbi:MAG TPA: hypothetical protein VM869_10695 [Enhygromyxa sp.]|nr:hypothetical protein [Enhygromyxa sp.]